MSETVAASRNRDGLTQVACRRYQDGAWQDYADVVTPEQEVTITWPGRDPLTLLAFAQDLDHLVLGHALLELCGPHQEPVIDHVQGRTYHLIWRQASRPDLPEQPAPLEAGALLELMSGFIGAPGRWDDTGCFHRAALADPKWGSVIWRLEDIGRHNCVDRAAGWCLEQGEVPERLMLLVSARATASLVAKAAKAGFPMLVSRSAVTTAAIERADHDGLTLVGFARSGRFTVFTDPTGRIMDPDRPPAATGQGGHTQA